MPSTESPPTLVKAVVSTPSVPMSGSAIPRSHACLVIVGASCGQVGRMIACFSAVRSPKVFRVLGDDYLNRSTRIFSGLRLIIVSLANHLSQYGDGTMKNSIGIISLVAIMFVAAGCASVSKEDCLLTDWYEIGRMDGRQGKPRTVFQGRAKACLEHGISANRQAYYKGHDQGLMYYCTEQNGFELGQKGFSYNSVCPLQLEPKFRAGYNKGMQAFCSEQKGFELGRQGQKYRYICPPEFEADFRAGYEKGRELYLYESKIAALHKRLKHIERKINKKEKELYSANLSDEQRNQIRAELKNLDVKYRDVSRELKYMEGNAPIVQVY